jgi:hypothetical protein
VLAFLGAPGKLTRFADFGRVAAWLERGAPGSKLAKKRGKRAPAEGDDAPEKPRERARIANP